MRQILFFHPINDFTGSTRALYNVIQEEYHNIKLTIIVTEDKKGFLSNLSNVKIIPIYYPTYKGKSIRIISNTIRKIHIFLLIVFIGTFHKEFYVNTILPYYGALGAKYLHKNLTYHIHEYFVKKNKFINKVEFVFNNVQSKRIFVSNYIKNCYPEKKDCPFIVKYNKLPTSFLNKVNVVPFEQRKRNSITMLTSLAKEKGICTFFELAKILPFYKFQLIISNTIENINTFIYTEYSQEKLPENIKIFPAQSNIHPFLEKTDLILNLTIPSLCIETFGLTIIEAMPYGIPAIVPNIGGPTEIIRHEINGLCIDVSNVEVVKEAITDILSNKKKYDFMASNALKIFKENFN